MGRLSAAYLRLPAWAQNLTLAGYGLWIMRERYGRDYDSEFALLEESQWYLPSDLSTLQQQRFWGMLRWACARVPYYRNDRSYDPPKNDDDAASVSVYLSACRPVEKSEIRRAPSQFCSDTPAFGSVRTINTSGTTGSPLVVRTSLRAISQNYAFWSRFLAWHGVDWRDRSATFAGRILFSSSNRQGPFWRDSWPLNRRFFSSYHISEQTAPSYLQSLEDWQPTYIDSYPSAVYELAVYAAAHGGTSCRPRVIFTSSETLEEYQRVLIESVFGCPVRDQYGGAEMCAFISQCEKGTYHVHPEFGIVELLSNDDSPCRPGQVGRIVATGLINWDMPLVRYDTGDLAVASDCVCDCGRNFPVVDRIVGRQDDVVRTLDGRAIGRLDPIFKGLQGISQCQIFQDAEGLIHVRVVPARGFGKQEERRLLQALRLRVGSDTPATVEVVDKIDRTASGKFRAVVSDYRPAQSLPR